MRPFLSLVSGLALVHSIAAAAIPNCAVFDSDFNLFILGPGGDFTLGPQSSWGSPSMTSLGTTTRPPFDSSLEPQCFLAQFFDAIYVLNADNANPSAVWILDVKTKSWSMQAVTAGGIDLSSAGLILDHDTNVFYALSGGQVSFLNMNDQVTGNSTPLAWTDQKSPSFTTTGYTPTMSIAQNHIFFFGVPGAPAANAYIYVIHFAFSQPDPQPFSGASFPAVGGAAPSLFSSAGVQELIAFIPSDFSKTYLLDVKVNTSAALAGPSDHTASQFFASETAVVQLTSAGKLFYLPVDQTDTAGTGANAHAAWTAINVNIPASSTTSGSNSTSTTGGSKGGSTGGSTGSGNGTGSGSGPSGSSGSTGTSAATGAVWAGVGKVSLAVVLGAVALLL